MSQINEVKNEDITDEDLKAFEEAQENGEIKDGSDKREIESEEETEEEAEESEESKEETEEEIEEEKGDDSTKSSKVEIKEVAGETPKERALRLEVTRLRREARAKSTNALFNENQVTPKEDYEELKDLGYNDEQIKTLDKAFDIIGEKKGFVRKDQSWKETAQGTLEDFINEHPEYAAENDKEDVYWGRFNAILKNDYNIAGKSPKQLKSIFERVDRDVKEELGDKEFSKGKIEAQKQKVKSVSSGASTSSAKTEETKPTKSTGNKSFMSSGHPGLVFKGFDEDEVKEFTK